MKLFVGLGNPGRKYSGNRHNVGFMAVERIAAAHGFTNWRKRFEGEAAEGMLDGEKVIILKPATYMNDSGRAVAAAVRFLKLDLADVVVFYDEIDLAAGKLKIKTGGGNAGHNGLRSISHLVGNDYTRLRIGVGHPGHKDLVAGYVLHDFAKTEREWLDPLLDAICDASPRLTGDTNARFLSDVALKLNPVPPVRESRKPRPNRSEVESRSKAGRGKGKAVTDNERAADASRKLPRNTTNDAAQKPQTTAKSGAAGGPKSRRPATGERQAKRQSALAENLQKWLKGRAEK